MVCKYCQNYHKTATVAVSGETPNQVLLLTFADAPTGITNENHFCFIVCQDIPTAGATIPVQLTINGTNVNLLDRYGNKVPGCGLQKGRIYKGYVGTNGEGTVTTHVLSYSLPTGCIRSYPCSILPQAEG